MPISIKLYRFHSGFSSGERDYFSPDSYIPSGTALDEQITLPKPQPPPNVVARFVHAVGAALDEEITLSKP
jgi:hypothetical protein